MKQDSLKSVLRIRQMIVDEAAQELADCLRKETEADHAVRATEAAIARETARAEDVDAADARVEEFGRWLRRTREELRLANETYELAQADTVRARAVLAAARTGMEAAKSLHAKRAAVARQSELRLEQHRLEEASLRRR